MTLASAATSAGLGITLAVAVALAAPQAGAPGATAESPTRRLALGQSHTCAIRSDGAVRCWGSAAVGQLGTGDTSTVGDGESAALSRQVDLGPGNTARTIVAGDFHTCVIVASVDRTRDSSVRCWGWNRFGQLGLAGTEDLGDDESVATARPVDLGPGAIARALAAGSNFTCALLRDGAVRCWGGNIGGQLGLGNTEVIGDDEVPGSVAPVDLGTGARAVAITAGGFHVCALLASGGLRCWGSNGAGELGVRNTATVGNAYPPALSPLVPLDPGRRAVRVAAGFSHTCAVSDDGSVRCWGSGAHGALGVGQGATIGDDEPVTSVPPVALRGLRAVDVVAGLFHTCVLLEDTSVRCWGANGSGQLGGTDPTGRAGPVTPADVAGVPLRVVEIAAGGYHTCARRLDDTVWCWGADDTGQLGRFVDAVSDRTLTSPS